MTNQTEIANPGTERFIICGPGDTPWVACDEIFKMDRFATINWIASGELASGGIQVFGFDPDKGTFRNASEEIAREVMTRWAHDGEGLSDWQRDFVELHVSVQAANSFRSAA